MRRIVLIIFCVLWTTLPQPVNALRITDQSGIRLSVLSHALHDLIKQVSQQPTHKKLHRLLQSLHQLDDLLDTYFHATNLRDPAMRPTILVMRKHIQRLLHGATPLLIEVNDILHYHPTVQRVIASAARKLGEYQTEAGALQAILATGDNEPAIIRYLIHVLQRLGHREAAHHIKARWLSGQTQPPSLP